MLGSSLVGYNYGVSGPFWFAAGCSPMIVFFSLLGISCKWKIPEAHTLLEIVRIRYGNHDPMYRIVIVLRLDRNCRAFGLYVPLSGKQPVRCR